MTDNATPHRVAKCPNSDAAVMEDSRLVSSHGHAKCPRCGRVIAIRFGKPDVFYAHNLKVYS